LLTSSIALAMGSGNQKEALMNFLVILNTFWSHKPLPPQVTDNKMLLELCARIKNNSFAILE
ncbi:hypothetical protein, partial [Serratia marcescens]|uniref:hypothetical protein n=1 Tax=Serratia marcescens TaxID=615 RepID=UPI00195302A3